MLNHKERYLYLIQVQNKPSQSMWHFYMYVYQQGSQMIMIPVVLKSKLRTLKWRKIIFILRKLSTNTEGEQG